jgi:phosphoribosylformylglycinamidine synthase subunit PurSL
VRCCEALYDVCTAYGIPLISGKDSMKNDYKIGDTKISIPPTLLFTGAAILEDATRVVSMDVKTAGDVVYVVGETKDEMGGSEFLNLLGILGTDAPRVDPVRARQTYLKLSDAIARGLVASCHDCSDGGLAVALAESAFAGGFGMLLDLSGIDVPSDVVGLFSESQSRVVGTVHPQDSDAFVAAMSDCHVMPLGTVTDEMNFKVASPNGVIIDAPISELKEAWQAPLRW